MNAAWPARKSKPNHWVAYAVVHQQWKLVTNRDVSHVELYDVAADPYEKKDLKKDNPTVVEAMKKKLESWKSTLPAQPDKECFSSERK